MALISGNTFPVKDALKSLGGRWNADAKGWEVPDAKAVEARALVAGAPKKEGGSKPRGYSRCVVCGVAASRYAPIYRSGECRDCYDERKMGY